MTTFHGLTTFDHRTPAAQVMQHREVVRLSADTFRVLGRQGTPYRVSIRRDDVRCTCPAGRFRRHCWHLDRVAQHLESLARRSPAVREVFANGLAWVRFRVLGKIEDDGRIELVGKVCCSYCGFGPLTVSAPVGEWIEGFCPNCRGEHRYQPSVGGL